MTEQLINLPDGKYVMPLQLWVLTVQSTRYSRASEDTVDVRVRIEEGDVKYRKTANSVGWYRRNIDGIELAKGHMFIDTLEDLQSLTSALPYSWR